MGHAMASGSHDPVTGRQTTGHEWNGIEELDSPVPRVVLFFLAVTAVFAVGYWILMPAWPTGLSYTKGLLGIDQRQLVTRQVEDAAAARSALTNRIATEDFVSLAADDQVMTYVRDSGRTLFADTCSACHGAGGKGGPGFPDLKGGSSLWGSDAATIAETIRVGINSAHPDTRVSQMLAFGRDGILERDAVLAASAYVRSLSGQKLTNVEQGRVETGRTVFAESCASCHGAAGKGQPDLGAPDLTDTRWIYGGDAQSVHASIYSGRQGQMPAWEGRLTPAEIKLLALYVGTLGGERP
jgi:cytochrome c oxidase cbb3-type subunit 3